jgi:signal peptidase II
VPAALAALTVALDQLSKHWVLQNLGPEPGDGTVALIDPWLRLIYTRNTGVAFSMLPGISRLFIPFAALICLGAIYYYRNYLPNHKLPVQLSLGLILGGALGNMIDRARFGFVVDFVQVGRFPVFNVADSAITVGTALLLVTLLVLERNDRALEAHRA